MYAARVGRAELTEPQISHNARVCYKSGPPQGVKQGAAEMGQASSGVSNSMIGQRRPAVAVSGIHPELAEKDSVAEAID
jgi:hypothetical protein